MSPSNVSSSSSSRPPSNFNVKDRHQTSVITEKDPVNTKKAVNELFKGKKHGSSSSSTGASSSRASSTIPGTMNEMQYFCV